MLRRPVAIVLIEARMFVDTPNLSEELQRSPSADTVHCIDERVPDLVIGMGLRSLVSRSRQFIAGLVRAVRSATPDSFAAPLLSIGGGAAVATTRSSGTRSISSSPAQQADRAPTTVASIYTIADSLGYIGWVDLGLVTAV